MHDKDCEAEFTSHGYTPCRCSERTGTPPDVIPRSLHGIWYEGHEAGFAAGCRATEAHQQRLSELFNEANRAHIKAVIQRDELLAVMKTECTCRAIEMCYRCEAIDFALAKAESK